MGEGWYDVGQVCLNGHVINSGFIRHPEYNQTHCGECGEKTITDCPNCNEQIKGYCHIPDAIFAFPYKPDRYCYSCGSPYPWTERRLEAAKLLIEEMELEQEEKKQLEESVEELVKDSPKAQVATLRYKRIIARAGKEAGELLKNIITDIISDTIRKTLYGM